jgi:acyl-activating enzyme 14
MFDSASSIMIFRLLDLFLFRFYRLLGIGTTGRPKGVTISHLAFITQSLAKIAIAGYGEDDVYLHTSPLVHIGGLSSAMAMLMVGACHVLLPKFDAKTALQVMEQNHITCFITVPAMMADLIRVNR